MKNIVDSCGWLEYFSDGKNAGFFAPAIENIKDLIVPAICVYEVFKRVCQQRSETEALKAVSAMGDGSIVGIDGDCAITAAKLSLDHGIPMADSIVLAVAHAHEATVWTQDVDFKDIQGVKYIAKK